MIDTKKSVYGTFGLTFNNTADAEAFYQSMKARGYDSDELSIMMSEATKDNAYGGDLPVHTAPNSTAENVAAGSGIGGTIGAIAGVIATLGTNAVIPGLGVVVAGPIIGALAGAGAGGATGALVGALTNIGVPEEYAKMYYRELQDGKTVVLVDPKTSDEINYVRDNITTLRGQHLNHWNA